VPVSVFPRDFWSELNPTEFFENNPVRATQTGVRVTQEQRPRKSAGRWHPWLSMSSTDGIASTMASDRRCDAKCSWTGVMTTPVELRAGVGLRRVMNGSESSRYDCVAVRGDGIDDIRLMSNEGGRAGRCRAEIPRNKNSHPRRAIVNGRFAQHICPIGIQLDDACLKYSPVRSVKDDFVRRWNDASETHAGVRSSRNRGTHQGDAGWQFHLVWRIRGRRDTDNECRRVATAPRSLGEASF